MTRRKLKILGSRYDRLNEIIDLNNKDDRKSIIVIPSPDKYYDMRRKKFYPIIKKRREVLEYDCSVLGFTPLKNTTNINTTTTTNTTPPSPDDKPTMIKLKTGFVALKIPYTELFELFTYD